MMKNKLKITFIASLFVLFLTVFSSYAFATDGTISLPQTQPNATYPWYITFKLNAGDDYTHLAYKTKNECVAAYNSYKSKNYPELKECQNFNNKTQSSGTTNSSSNSNVTNISGQNTLPSDTTTYNLLAPIGKMKTIGPTTMADYFNTIIKILIGLCAILAVIMIVIGGVQYMGKDSIFGKVEAKGKIVKAIFGLIIALASYALLNTINPDLLGVSGLNIQTVSGEIEETPWETYEKGDNITSCPEGFVDVDVRYGDSTEGSPEKINVCKSIANKLVSLINAAYRDKNIKFSGYGSRSTKTQRELRAKNCGGLAYVDNAAAKCSPATALPGKSNHEKGIAVDFRCNGQRITSIDSECYKWLKSNASNYGLKNNYSAIKEAWHWSTTGY